MSNRYPTCDYVRRTKNPETNEGIAEYHCNKFNWTEPTFNIVNGVQEINYKLFEQCIGCPYNNPQEQ